MWQLTAYFFAGAFLINSVPHLVAGVSGRGFPSPFASPPGRGESPPVVNVLWGSFNLAVGYCLIFLVGSFDFSMLSHALASGLGGLIMGLILAWHFGEVYRA